MAGFSFSEVNQLLNQHHTFGDPALLRRELIEAQPKAIPNVTKEKRSIGFGRE